MIIIKLVDVLYFLPSDLRFFVQNFELSFKYYLVILEVLNKVCVINSLDIQRRKNIQKILELITNTIRNTKSKISLEEKDINSVNWILGKLFLNFTNISYISIDSITKYRVIQKYVFMAKKYMIVTIC